MNVFKINNFSFTLKSFYSGSLFTFIFLFIWLVIRRLPIALNHIGIELYGIIPPIMIMLYILGYDYGVYLIDSYRDLKIDNSKVFAHFLSKTLSKGLIAMLVLTPLFILMIAFTGGEGALLLLYLPYTFLYYFASVFLLIVVFQFIKLFSKSPQHVLFRGTLFLFILGIVFYLIPFFFYLKNVLLVQAEVIA